MTTFERSVDLDVDFDRAWGWHLQRGALNRLLPPWERVLVDAPAAIAEGERAHLSVSIGPVALGWDARISAVSDGRFVDEMERGPFATWRHEHAVERVGDRARLVDRVEYTLPLAPFSHVARPMIARRIERMFAYRHATTREDLRVHDLLASEPLQIGVTGSSGLLGAALLPYLEGGGHTVRPLGRRPTDEDLRGLDAVVHLAGEPVAAARWTQAKKARIRDSRIEGTRQLAERIAALDEAERPRVLVCASAVGLYGDRGDAQLDEDSPPGEGFLADVVRGWEDATRAASEAGVRVTNVRLGVVLAGQGGALTKIAAPFRAGVGGPLGDPGAWMPWISLDDALDVVLRCLVDDRARGPVNGVRGAVTQGELAKTLGRVLRRPASLRVPRWALRAALGREQADEVLASARVEPAKLNALGHRFRHDTLEDALRHVLGRPS